MFVRIRAPARQIHLQEDVAIVHETAPEVDARTGTLEERYDRLWQAYGAGIARVAAAYESRAERREDLLQDIRLAVWVALPNFRGESSLRTFVFRIAHNRSLSHVWRRGKRERTEETQDVRDARADPEARLIHETNESQLMAAVSELPIPLRQAMMLALEDLPYAEIGAVLGISESNVAVRISRGRKLLKEKLGGNR